MSRILATLHVVALLSIGSPVVVLAQPSPSESAFDRYLESRLEEANEVVTGDGVIEGVVRLHDDGEPLSDFVVQLVPNREADELVADSWEERVEHWIASHIWKEQRTRILVTDGQGRFRSDDLPLDASYRLVARADPSYRVRRAPDALVPSQTPPVEVIARRLVTRPRHPVTFAAFANGTPIDMSEVRVQCVERVSGPRVIQTSLGDWSQNGLQTGTYEVTAIYRDLESVPIEITVAGPVANPIRLDLVPQTIVAGWIDESRHRTLGFLRDGEFVRAPRSEGLGPRVDGAFRFSMVPGTHQFAILGPDGIEPVSEARIVPGFNVVDLAPPTPSDRHIRVRVSFPAPAPDQVWYRLDLRRGGARPMSGGGHVEALPGARTEVTLTANDDFCSVWRDGEPGDLWLHVTTAEYGTRTVALRPGQTEVSVAFERPSFLELQLPRYHDHELVGRIEAWVQSDETDRPQPTAILPDAFGFLEPKLLSPGSYTIEIRGRGLPHEHGRNILATRQVTLDPGRNVVSIPLP